MKLEKMMMTKKQRVAGKRKRELATAASLSGNAGEEGVLSGASPAPENETNEEVEVAEAAQIDGEDKAHGHCLFSGPENSANPSHPPHSPPPLAASSPSPASMATAAKPHLTTHTTSPVTAGNLRKTIPPTDASSPPTVSPSLSSPVTSQAATVASSPTVASLKKRSAADSERRRPAWLRVG